MYLFDKQGDNIWVYKADLNQDAVSRFRQEEMMKIKDTCCFEFEASKANKSLERALYKAQNKVIDIFISELEYEGKFFHNYHKIKSSLNAEMFLNGYYEGTHNNANIIRVHDYNREKLSLGIVKYLLINQNYFENFDGDICLKGIISIPETLYIFELLQKGRFDYLNSVDITSLLNLFSFCEKPIAKIPFDLLSKKNSGGLGDINQATLLKKVDGTQKVIKMARCHGYIE